ncbi:MAG: hypothetical protein ACTSU4_12005 [Promethearchaeota archaeon]
MNERIILHDSVKGISSQGTHAGSIICKHGNPSDSIIFCDNLTISEENSIEIHEGLIVGFEYNEVLDKKTAFSRKINLNESINNTLLEYAVLIPNRIMDQFEEGQFSESYPFALTLLHTAGLYLLENSLVRINHLDFVIGEILKNPVCLVENGIVLADRVVIDEKGNPVFYDGIIVGRDQEENLSVSHEPIVFVEDINLIYIIILGRESLRE